MQKLPWKSLVAVLLILFTLSRFYIFTHPPRYYSDVKADYERYANMWRYGLTPYLLHLYEYPPATIPLLSIPLTLDQAGIGKYYSNYRTQILVIDTLFFLYLLFIVQKIPWLKNRQFESLLAYIILTTLAKDFFYEGIDLAFAASIMMSVTLFLFTQKKNFLIEVLIWIFFWLSTALKFLTLPLAVPFFLLNKSSNWKKQIAACLIGFLIVWGLPLFLYRSSLQVSFVHNNARPIKYASFPAHIIRWIDVFTNTEEQLMVAPDFEYQGPVSTVVTRVTKIVFPLSLFSLLIYATIMIIKKQFGRLPFSISAIQKYLFATKGLDSTQNTALALVFYVLLCFTLFIFAKIFSQPFHIWYIAAISIFPFQKRKTWYSALLLCMLMILLDMTSLLHIKGNFLIAKTVEIGLVRDAFRFIPIFILTPMIFNEIKKNPYLRAST